jgi:hypothetical protein
VSGLERESLTLGTPRAHVRSIVPTAANALCGLVRRNLNPSDETTIASSSFDHDLRATSVSSDRAHVAPAERACLLESVTEPVRMGAPAPLAIPLTLQPQPQVKLMPLRLQTPRSPASSSASSSGRGKDDSGRAAWESPSHCATAAVLGAPAATAV